MTVQDVLNELQKCDPALPVVLRDADTGLGLLDLAFHHDHDHVELEASYIGPYWGDADGRH